MAFKLDSELSAVNSILASIGQAPVNTLTRVVTTNSPPNQLNGPNAGRTVYEETIYENPEVALCRNILQECNVDVQNEVWHFNLEPALPFTPLTSADPIMDGRIAVPQGALNMDVSGGQVWRTTNVVDRDGYLYDLDRHSFNWKQSKMKMPLYCDVTWLYPFEQIPPVFQRYVTLKASARAATQLVANADLFKLLSSQEAIARSNCVQQDCQMGDYTYFGWPQGTVYRSYQPYRTLARGQYGPAPLGPFNNMLPGLR